ncbi:MAG: hypothetical protein M3Y45_00825 [Actinomycetota bacterium]|nr:hypothetical protein [Actinomycetota bacterium]
MSPTETIEISCEVESANGSIRGLVRDRQGNQLSFTGWTEFASALTALIGDTRNQITDKEK